MDGQRLGHHTVSRLTVHIVWATKYRYPVLVGELKPRCRALLIQICKAEDVKIVGGGLHPRRRTGGQVISGLDDTGPQTQPGAGTPDWSAAAFRCTA